MKTVLVKDSAGNEYNLPEKKLKEFKDLDAKIVSTYDNQLLSMTDEHLALCDVWFNKFDRYMI